MTWIDWIAAVTLFLLGSIHNFIAAPMSYESFSTPALWFITGGITLWYAAIARFAALSNFILLGFVVSFVYVKQSWADPQNALLFAPAAWLSARSIRASF